MIPSQSPITPIPFDELPVGTFFISQNPRVRYMKIKAGCPPHSKHDFVSVPSGLLYQMGPKRQKELVVPMTPREVSEWILKSNTPEWEAETERLMQEALAEDDL